MAVQLLINGPGIWLKMVWKSREISFSDFAGHPVVVEEGERCIVSDSVDESPDIQATYLLLRWTVVKSWRPLYFGEL